MDTVSVSAEVRVDTTDQGTGRRRRFSAAFKRRVVEETLDGSDSVSVVARRHDLNTNLLFNWRRQYQAGLLPAVSEEAALVPIRLIAGEQRAPSKASGGGAELELVLAQGHRVTIRGLSDPAILQAALKALVG